ncbi:MAG: DUF1848 family protein [Planctomycetes bacterium]|jgi:hypothetical protein|nr:DUF1848 family protein [Planctomycetota bacterium]
MLLAQGSEMGRIISLSRRTDIPAFYADWFLRRVQEGFAGVVSPYGRSRYLVSLEPQAVDCFVFWSKDFTPFIPHLNTLDRLGYRFYFNYTLTGLPAVFESHVDKEAALKTLEYLSTRYSPRHINWRFDPIILSSITGPDFWLDAFERLAARLAGRVERCYFSFVTAYEKVRHNFLQLLLHDGIGILQPHPEEKIALADRLAAIGQRYGIRMYSCCGDYLLSDWVQKAHCIDGGIIEQLFFPQGLQYQQKPTRRECGCTESIDLGTYDTCPHGCVYCYANASREVAGRAFQRHDPDAAFLGFDKTRSDAWVAEIRGRPDPEAPALF